jgi:hypothetical protein
LYLLSVLSLYSKHLRTPLCLRHKFLPQLCPYPVCYQGLVPSRTHIELQHITYCINREPETVDISPVHACTARLAVQHIVLPRITLDLSASPVFWRTRYRATHVVRHRLEIVYQTIRMNTLSGEAGDLHNTPHLVSSGLRHVVNTQKGTPCSSLTHTSE